MSLDRQVDQVVVRPFSPDEWDVYKAVRLQSLQVNPEAYESSYTKESAWPGSFIYMNFNCGGNNVA